MKVAIVTDSTAYLPDDVKDKYHIHTVPLSVVFGNASYREGIDITTEAFYEKVKHADSLPKTSQPSIGEIEGKYRELSETHDAVISIHLSSGISGTYQAASSAGEVVDGIKVYPYDSEISCMAQGFYCIEAAQLAAKGASPEEIIARLDDMKAVMRAYFMVDDLSHLQRGGRLNGAQAFVGSLLQVKPVLHFVDKIIVPFEKIRTRKKAIKRILGMLEEDLATGKSYKIVFIHANNAQTVIDLQQTITTQYSNVETMTSYFGPVIGTHLGEGAIGICWYEK
ncbi:DegV family protein [Lentibacillus saliphilus]|uniref:DegV family protein n=1 Tax=Lentibacillus saliphilus TaxID=2737028 RepID=UPI001C301B1C|nr:DegV family protein [Lentibacillus saliphilus]